MNNFNFDLSVSLQTYLRKEDADLKQRTGIRYTPQTISLDYLRTLVKQGHWFCQIFNTKDNPFGTGEKSLKNFNYAQMIFVDVDKSDISMNEFLSKSTKFPSIIYNTPNNEKNGLYRFRLGYLLEHPIYDKDTYPKVHDAIIDNLIKKDIPTFVYDKHGKSANQQFAGNANGKDNCMIFHNMFTFEEVFANKNGNVSFSFLPILNAKKNNNPKTEKPKEKINPNKEKTKNPKHYIEETFYNDFWKLSYSDLITKYHDTYHYFDKSDIEFNEDGFVILGDDYKEIKRSFSVKKLYKEDGSVRFLTKKIKDGEDRHHKLYYSAMVMKQILPTITATHLLYNLVCELYYYFDNSDGKFSKKELLDKAIHVFNKPIEEIKMEKGTDKKFVVSKTWCRQNNTTPNSQKMKVRKILNFQKIGEIYDTSLSVKENLQIFKELGIKTSQRTLYNFCKENGINTKGEKS